MPQQPNQPNRRRNGPLNGNQTPYNEPELYKNLVISKSDKQLDELSDSLPTGFVDEEELDMLRGYQETLSEFRFLCRSLGIDEDKLADRSRFAELLASRITFLSQSSKSKGGFGVKAVRTDRIIQDENVYNQHVQGEEEEAGFFEKLMEKANNSDTELGINGADVALGQRDRRDGWR